MKSRIELFGKLTRMLFEMLFVMLLTIFFENVLIKHEPGVVNRVILAVIYIISFVVKNTARMRIIALGVHVALGGVMFLLPIDTVSKWMLVVIICYLMFSAMDYIGYGNKPKPLEEPPWACFFIIVIMYLFGIYTKSYIFMNYTYVFALLMLVVYYLITYLEGLKKYVDSSKEVEEIHLKKVISRNNTIVFGIIVLLVVCMVIGYLIDYSKVEAILKAIGGKILKLFGSVLMIFLLLYDNVIKETADRPDAFNTEAINSMKGHARTALDSSMVFLYIACAFIVFIILKKLLTIAVKLLFARNKSQDDIVEEAESISYIAEEKPAKKSIFKRLSDEEKFRNKYKKHIETYKYDIKLSNNRTCRDIADEISQCELGDVSDITEMYAQVRYGKVPVDKPMLRKINSLVRK